MPKIWLLHDVSRRGVVVRTQNGEVHTVFNRELEREVKKGDVVSWSMGTGRFTADRTYEGKVIGMVLHAEDAEEDTSEEEG